MKKILSLVTLLGALAGTASAAPYYLPSPAGGALTPYDWQPVYSADFIYGFSTGDVAPDTYGARLNLSLYNTAAGSARHQFTISAGYDQGSHNVDVLFRDVNARVDIEMDRIPLTLGYDINLGITESVFIDLGAKAGYAWGNIDSKVKESGSMSNRSVSDTLGGFTFSLGAGIKVQCSDSIYVKLGYEFSRTFFGKIDNENFNHGMQRSLNYGQHSILFGIGATF